MEVTTYCTSPDAKHLDQCQAEVGTVSPPEFCRTDPPCCIKVTHPFHPWSGRIFPIQGSLLSKKSQLIRCIVGKDGLRRFPRDWTNLREVDDFDRVSSGRALFRIDDLMELRSLVDVLLDAHK